MCDMRQTKLRDGGHDLAYNTCEVDYVPTNSKVPC